MNHQEKTELLIRVDTRVENIEIWCKNHMAHHQRLLYAFVAAAVSVVLAEATTIVALMIALNGVANQG